MKAKVSFVLVLAFVFSLVGVGFQPAQAAEIEPLNGEFADCYREGFAAWTEDQTITVFSAEHRRPNGKPAESCGGIGKTDLYVWRWYTEPGTKCWKDMCITNRISNDTPNGKPLWVTDYHALNGYKLLRAGWYNQRIGH